MRITKERSQQFKAFVFTGNGHTEASNLAGLCAKFDGKEKVLWFPAAPPCLVRQRRTGLSALKVLRDLVVGYNIDKLLFLVDREHFKEGTRRKGIEIEEIKEFLIRELRTTIQTVTELMSQNAYVLNCLFGSQYFELCVAIRGMTLNADEERAQLINLKLGKELEPDSREIWRYLKNEGIDEKSLIAESSIKYLRQAFPSLCCALEWIEEQT